jgi:hypothetical protein
VVRPPTRLLTLESSHAARRAIEAIWADIVDHAKPLPRAVDLRQILDMCTSLGGYQGILKMFGEWVVSTTQAASQQEPALFLDLITSCYALIRMGIFVQGASEAGDEIERTEALRLGRHVQTFVCSVALISYLRDIVTAVLDDIIDATGPSDNILVSMWTSLLSHWENLLLHIGKHLEEAFSPVRGSIYL